MTTLELTLFAKAGGPLTKSIRLDKSGKIVSDGSGCLMAKGTARRVLFSGMTELANIIGGIKPDEALTSGALRHDLPAMVRVTTKSARDKMNGSAPPDLIARTAEAITFVADQPALVLFDFDQKGMPESVAARLAELGGFWNALTFIVPPLASAGHLIRASTSAGLYRKDTGAQLGGSGGLHAYAAARDGSDIDRFLKVLHARCWLAGLGWLMVGDAGQFLERSIIDRMVGAPERLIFEGPPILTPPLAQHLACRAPQYQEGDLLDTKLCGDLTVAEASRYRDLIRAEEKRLTPERARKRTLFIDAKGQELSKRTGLDPAAARQIIERQCDGILMPEIILPFDDPALDGVTVGQVLDRPESFIGETLSDPLEGVEYGRGKAKVLTRPDGTPFIHSFAHGRTLYELRRELPRKVVQVISGQLPFVIDSAEQALIERDAEIFERNRLPVYLGHDEPDASHFVAHARRVSFIYETDHLADHWTRHVDFQKFNVRSNDWHSIDCPEKVVKAYLQRRGRRHLRRLRAVVSAPTLRPDGSILDQPGYDAETRLFYDPCGVEYPEIPANPSAQQTKDALDLLISPIRLFPFVDNASRSVTLSGMLTALVRGSLPTAPLHASTAPVAGSGKSTLDNIIAIMAIGRTCHPIAETTDTKEFEKRIASALIRGDQIIPFDNCTVPLGGGLLCQAITEPSVAIRGFNTKSR